ncbi:CotS family spore coat protein [Geobacillus subterraneus]|uniref:CotS family spore coat protein n=1 Tax=Geobacillus subterraneus TaxID=129338 RepID=UPI002AC9B5AD|nr:CotS family spore coat protein [Geobacillus subterraneus]WPZ19167.1 CotS family spore coat protein [Geobacillus subterraneus]
MQSPWIAAKVLELYPYQVEQIELQSVRPKETVWTVATAEGEKMLRQREAVPGRMLFYAEAHRHLQQRQFPIAPLCRTKNGGLCVAGGTQAYALYDAVSGKEVSYYDVEQLEHVFEFLGLFHVASQQFSPSPKAKKRNRLGKWPKTYTWKLQELSGYKKMAASFVDDPFSILFSETVGAMLDAGEEAVEQLDSDAYAEWTAGPNRWTGFIHKDISLSHLVETEETMMMRYLPAVVIDLPVRDIQVLLHKVMKKMAVWDEELAARLIQAYHRTHPLTDGQYRLLEAELLFPHLFASVARKYYLGAKDNWSDEKYMWELQTAITVERTKQDALRRTPLPSLL